MKVKKNRQVEPSEILKRGERLRRIQFLMLEISKINKLNPLNWPRYFKLLSKSTKLILRDI